MARKAEESFNLTSAVRMTEGMLRQFKKKAPPPGGHWDPEQVLEAQERARKLEIGMRYLENRIREVAREREHIGQALEKMELTVAWRVGEDVAKRIAQTEVPDPRDIALLDLITKEIRLEMEHKHLCEDLEKKNRAMEKVMADIDKMLIKAPWFNCGNFQVTEKPREKVKSLRFNSFTQVKIFKQSQAACSIQYLESDTMPTFSERRFSSISPIKKEEEAIPVNLKQLSEEAKESLTEEEKDEDYDPPKAPETSEGEEGFDVSDQLKKLKEGMLGGKTKSAIKSIPEMKDNEKKSSLLEDLSTPIYEEAFTLQPTGSQNIHNNIVQGKAGNSSVSSLDANGSENSLSASSVQTSNSMESEDSIHAPPVQTPVPNDIKNSTCAPPDQTPFSEVLESSVIITMLQSPMPSESEYDSIVSMPILPQTKEKPDKENEES